MRFASAILTIPLLVSAIPTSRSDSFTIQDAEVLGAIPHEMEKLGWTMDLNELRLVQFDEEEPPV